jgi:predicted RNA-binding Zn ribbon-like protein
MNPLPNRAKHVAKRMRHVAARETSRIAAFDGLPLVGGHPALDLLNTVEFRGRPEPGDRLNSFENLARWSTVAGLLTRDELTRIAIDSAKRSPRATRALDSATTLREALYAVMVAHLLRTPLPRAASRIVEQLLRSASTVSKLRYGKVGSPFSWHVPIRGPEDITARLADSANHLLLSLDRVTVQRCKAPNCDWLFIDHSHGHRRLWCQPNKCGNLVRVRRSRRGDTAARRCDGG